MRLGTRDPESDGSRAPPPAPLRDPSQSGQGREMTGMVACTIAAKNYLAQVRVLTNSFLREVPGGRMVTLLLDAEPEDATLFDEPFEVVTPIEVMGRLEFGEMLAMYNVVELATAVKPWLLEHLLKQASAVTYFDPDIEIFSSPQFIDDLARVHGLVLTPHATDPLPRGDALTPGEDLILSSGIFNLGFVAVGGAVGLAVVRWWQSRLLRECVINPSVNRFVDQRWMDLAPGYFDPFILRHAGCNVAWWNLPTRRITSEHGAWQVNGEPLVFFHFSGYDPLVPHLISKHQGRHPRVLLSERPDICPLLDRYHAQMLEQGWATWSNVRYGLTQVAGLPLDDTMRSVARRAILEADEQKSEPPPNLLTDGADQFAAWLATSEVMTPSMEGIGRYLYELYLRRPDLQAEFPDVPGDDSPRYLTHVQQVLVPEGAVPAAVVAAGSALDQRSEVPISNLSPGLNVIAYFTAESGVGQAARFLLKGIKAAGIPHATVTYDRIPGRAGFRFGGTRPDEARFDTNLICINADQILAANHWLGDRLRGHRYRIGLWWWETETFPESFDDAFAVVDEVWVGSAFVGDAIRARTDKPVTVIPMPVVVPEPNGKGRAVAGIAADTFLVLYTFDFNSVLERKNPRAAIEAFRRAFSEDDGATLLLKSINGDQHIEALEALRLDTMARHDIVVRDGYLDSVTNCSLIAECDCYLSLHRSEGFGITIAEAMAYGRPVVATDYSANTEFMDDSTSFPVSVVMVPIPDGAGPYEAGTLWAEPDIEAAAAALRRVYDDPTEAKRRGRAAAERMGHSRSPELAGTAIKQRLDEIHESHRGEDGMTDSKPLLDEFASRLSSTGATPWNTSRASGAALAQRALLRTLRPYLTRRSEVDEVLLQILTEMNARLDGLVEDVHALENHVHAVNADLNTSNRELQALGVDLAQEIGAVRLIAGHTEALLTTPMYMRDPNEFRLTGPEGVILGYEGALTHGVNPDDAYRAFQEVFRGPETLITASLAAYPELFATGGTVADVGCGRGEFLRLLVNSDRVALGVDQDPGMVAVAQAAGIGEVVLGDGIAWLETRDEGSLDGVFAAQVIEHLSEADLMRFLRAAHRALDPARGVLVAETINPHFIPALRAFWVDLTHQLIIYPEVALALARLVGFPAATITFSGGTGDASVDLGAVGCFALVASRSATPDPSSRGG